MASIENFNHFFKATVDVENCELEIEPTQAFFDADTLFQADLARDLMGLSDAIYREAVLRFQDENKRIYGANDND